MLFNLWVKFVELFFSKWEIVQHSYEVGAKDILTDWKWKVLLPLSVNKGVKTYSSRAEKVTIIYEKNTYSGKIRRKFVQGWIEPIVLYGSRLEKINKEKEERKLRQIEDESLRELDAKLLKLINDKT